ncbi:MAG: NUDIX domain-containing protein [Candidatus Heimdallarchaeota archaeon]|nr:NUDIX domain-containing protein [Candidatus Heimdallarchaeota archaeon]
MKPDILNIVVAGIRWGKKWLLIKRNKGDYQNKWALVGGKIEKNEELKEGILREIAEETGLNVKWEGVKGTINERLIEEDKEGNIRHFIIIVCQTSTEEGKLISTEEGELRWFTINDIDSRKEQIIPSDYYMITELLLKEKKSKAIEIEMIQSKEGLELTRILEY